MSDTPKSASMGAETTITRGKQSRIIDEMSKPLPWKPPTIREGPLASVGLSVSVGMNTEFSREKIDVTAWCTLPCEPSKEARDAAYEECYVHIEKEVRQRLDKAISEFFPELVKE